VTTPVCTVTQTLGGRRAEWGCSVAQPVGPSRPGRARVSEPRPAQQHSHLRSLRGPLHGPRQHGAPGGLPRSFPAASWNVPAPPLPQLNVGDLQQQQQQNLQDPPGALGMLRVYPELYGALGLLRSATLDQRVGALVALLKVARVLGVLEGSLRPLIQWLIGPEAESATPP